MRSNCALNYGLELFGDKWTLLIVRDLMFYNKRYYNEFLSSPEGISTNILADRLALLEREGFVKKLKDGNLRHKYSYRLSQRGADLLPVVIAISLWSVSHNTSSVLFNFDFIPNKETTLVQLMEELQMKVNEQHGLI